MVENEKINFLDDNAVPESFPTLTTPVTTSVGNAPGMSSYANITGKPSRKKVNVHTFITPGGNRIDVVVLVDSIRDISERFTNTTYGFFLGKKVAYPVVTNYVRDIWGSMDELDAMLENGPWFIRNNPPDENLLKEDINTVLVWVKLHGVPATAFSEDGLSTISTKVGTPLMLDSYTSDMFLQPWEYRPVTQKPNASSSGNKKNGVEPTVEGTSSGSYFMHIDNDAEFASNTPICEKINKIERQIGEGKLRLLDNDENPLLSTGSVESDSEVEVVFDDTANLMISTSGKDGSDKGYGTNSFLEQWRDSYPNNDDYDPYDDDMYEHLQSICD
uniref:Uncharacterized protein n=1 Tax=Tanacetum cinerariifolium TaxID=118510 RepID=A0A6L2L6C9_TANCI|nr:hypothetical protein [Tanacetum cinerariifolium]